ncbi:hypothetical protein [Scopulibacillus darangshiensis]|nr:hypothetical protein [Scopulibacillus darangshiensis]
MPLQNKIWASMVLIGITGGLDFYALKQSFVTIMLKEVVLMVADHKYAVLLQHIRYSQRLFKNIYGHSPLISQLSDATGLSEEKILESLEFGEQQFMVYNRGQARV